MSYIYLSDVELVGLDVALDLVYRFGLRADVEDSHKPWTWTRLARVVWLGLHMASTARLSEDRMRLLLLLALRVRPHIKSTRLVGARRGSIDVTGLRWWTGAGSENDLPVPLHVVQDFAYGRTSKAEFRDALLASDARKPRQRRSRSLRSLGIVR